MEQLVLWEEIRLLVERITAQQCRESGITLYKVVRWRESSLVYRSLIEGHHSQEYRIGELATSSYLFFCFRTHEEARAYLREQQGLYHDDAYCILKCHAFDTLECPGWICGQNFKESWSAYWFALHQQNAKWITYLSDQLGPSKLLAPQGTVLSHGLIPFDIF